MYKFEWITSLNQHIHTWLSHYEKVFVMVWVQWDDSGLSLCNIKPVKRLIGFTINNTSTKDTIKKLIIEPYINLQISKISYPANIRNSSLQTAIPKTSARSNSEKKKEMKKEEDIRTISKKVYETTSWTYFFLQQKY